MDTRFVECRTTCAAGAVVWSGCSCQTMIWVNIHDSKTHLLLRNSCRELGCFASRMRTAEKQNVTVGVFPFESAQAVAGVLEWFCKLDFPRGELRR